MIRFQVDALYLGESAFSNLPSLHFSVSSLQCYRCVREDEADALKHCDLPTSSLGNNEIVNCTDADYRCAIVKTILKDGSVTTFRRSCSATEACLSKCSDPDSEGKVVCGSCCDEDLCNKGEGPKASELSGASTIITIRALFMLGYFLTVWLLM